jgi:hypothetical protein
VFISVHVSAVALAKAGSWLQNENAWDHRRAWAGEHIGLLPTDNRTFSRTHRQQALSRVCHR